MNFAPMILTLPSILANKINPDTFLTAPKVSTQSKSKKLTSHLFLANNA